MTRDSLLESLKRAGTPPDVLAAMSAVAREEFVPKASANLAWDDCALPLGSGSTISQPSMVAVVLQELQLSPGLRVLEVGSGSGYLLALIEAMGAEATGIEIDRTLSEESRSRLPGSIMIIEGDAAKVERNPPYGRIVFSASLDDVPAWAIGDLTIAGFALAPLGRNLQELVRVYRNGMRERTGRLCRFVPFR